MGDRFRYMVAWWPARSRWPEAGRVEVVPWPARRRLPGASTYGDCNREFHQLDDDEARAQILRDLALELISRDGIPVADLFREFSKIPEWRAMRIRGYVAFLPDQYDRLEPHNP